MQIYDLSLGAQIPNRIRGEVSGTHYQTIPLWVFDSGQVTNDLPHPSLFEVRATPQYSTTRARAIKSNSEYIFILSGKRVFWIKLTLYHFTGVWPVKISIAYE